MVTLRLESRERSQLAWNFHQHIANAVDRMIKLCSVTSKLPLILRFPAGWAAHTSGVRSYYCGTNGMSTPDRTVTRSQTNNCWDLICTNTATGHWCRLETTLSWLNGATHALR